MKKKLMRFRFDIQFNKKNGMIELNARQELSMIPSAKAYEDAFKLIKEYFDKQIEENRRIDNEVYGDIEKPYFQSIP